MFFPNGHQLLIFQFPLPFNRALIGVLIKIYIYLENSPLNEFQMKKPILLLLEEKKHAVMLAHPYLI